MPGVKRSYIFAFAITAENQGNMTCACIHLLVQQSNTNVEHSQQSGTPSRIV